MVAVTSAVPVNLLHINGVDLTPLATRTTVSLIQAKQLGPAVPEQSAGMKLQVIVQIHGAQVVTMV